MKAIETVDTNNNQLIDQLFILMFISVMILEAYFNIAFLSLGGQSLPFLHAIGDATRAMPLVIQPEQHQPDFVPQTPFLFVPHHFCCIVVF